MTKMRVVGIKMSHDPSSVKVLYEKNGSMYIRSGTDGFAAGQPVKAPVKSLMNKWGFRPVEGSAEFRDADELIDGLTGFELSTSGKVKYVGR